MSKDENLAFLEEKKRQIIEDYKECEKEQEKLRRQEQRVKSQLDITETILKEKHRRMSDDDPVTFHGSGCEIDDVAFIDQRKTTLAHTLVKVVEEELDIKQDEENT